MDEVKQKGRTPKIVTEVDDFGRKKFTLKQNNSASEGEHDEKEQKFIDTGKHTSTLIGRDEKIETDKYIGKIEGTKKKKKTEVFYCEVCQVGFKCDLAYITHINSPSHNRKLGMNMKVEAVSLETVASKLARMAEEKNKSKHEKIMEKKLGKNWQADLIKKQQQGQKNITQGLAPTTKQAVMKIQNNKNGEQEEEQEAPESEDEDQKMMKFLGLPTSFGSKKKKY